MASATLPRLCLGFSRAACSSAAAGVFLGGLTGLLFAATGFLGGGEDRNLLLLAPFGLTPRGIPLLLDQRALSGGVFGRR